jgi:hypothetical protein
MIKPMNMARKRGAQAVLMALEADEASARGGFACMFSTSDEYETAMIALRRAQGRYGRPYGSWPLAVFIGSMLLVTGIVLLWH